jgi:hypothetical protein
MPLLLQFKQWERELEIGHRETTHRMWLCNEYYENISLHI